MSPEEKIEAAEKLIARTLEEIEAIAAEATPGPYSLHECSQGAELMMLGGPSRKYVATVRIHQVPRHMGEWEEKKRTKTAELLAELPRLLAIAQEQRAEIARLKRAIIEANECLMTFGGVDLIYYMRDSWARDATQQSIETVEKVLLTKK